jgi:cytochrome oxidase Cu insertion factor (SCO1/SenC/PrrC family)
MNTNRRKFLAAMPVAAALGMAAKSALGAEQRTEPAAEGAKIDPRKRDAFPDVEVIAHTGERFRFYEDLIKNRIVLVNFMSIRGEDHYPITANLAKVARRLHDKLGGGRVLINSVTRDPDHDTPERLKDFAEAHGVVPGWRLLTGSRHMTDTLALRLYRHHPHGGYRRVVDVVFYGNGGIGVWGAFPGLIDPDDAATRVTWLMPKKRPAVLRRAGPRRVAAPGKSSDNRELG